MSSPLNPAVPAGSAVADVQASASAVNGLASRLAQESGATAHNRSANCQQDLWFTVFFDGTGNNRDIDVPTFEHSNVARLFRATSENSPTAGRYRFYVPGIGTPFREIGDPGGRLAMAVAAGGEARIDWAIKQVLTEVANAAARAQNPVNKIRCINIAVFGFSRGAATARAFARRIADLCRQDGAAWAWKDGGHPARLYFMGLFDTVASTGLPASARKFSGEALALSPVLGGLPIFFASTADGHGGWASNLRVPQMVERCVHYCAVHEIRNSFPLDTLLEDGHYPANCHEVYYPGVHSNVGGGYRPGEGGRNVNRYAMLSLVPLKAMYDEAVRAGVPLRAIEGLSDAIKDDFVPPTDSDKNARLQLGQRFNHYMSTVGWGGRSVGDTVLAHMRMYFRWRIIHVGRKTVAHRQGQKDWDEQRLQAYEAGLTQERREKAEALHRLQQQYRAAEDARDAAWSWYCRGRAHEDRRSAYDAAAARGESARWAMINEEASVATMPADSKTLLAALDKFDHQFLEDSAKVRAADSRKLRPFARILREAWEDPPLNDAQIIAFFDEYVTDSLAGFDADRTRAVDARWLYQGGDSMVDYSMLELGPKTPQASALT